MLHDQHCHTKYSLDSKASLEEYYKICTKYNCKYFITTEHIDFNCVCNNQDWIVDYQKLKKELNDLHKKYTSCIPLLGVELGYRNEYISKMQDVIDSNSFDVVNLSVHDNGIYDYYEQEGFIREGIPKMLKTYFNNILDALGNFSDFDVLSHFDFGFKTAYLLDNAVTINTYEKEVRTIFKILIKKEKTLEINMKVENMIDHKHLNTILDWYYEEGGKNITLSSDSHNEETYENYYQTRNEYINILKRHGFNKLSYFIKRKHYTYAI